MPIINQASQKPKTEDATWAPKPNSSFHSRRVSVEDASEVELDADDVKQKSPLAQDSLAKEAPGSNVLVAPTVTTTLSKTRAPQKPLFAAISEDSEEETVDDYRESAEVIRQKPATFRPILSIPATFFGKPKMPLKSAWSTLLQSIDECLDERSSIISLESGLSSGLVLTPQPPEYIHCTHDDKATDSPSL